MQVVQSVGIVIYPMINSFCKFAEFVIFPHGAALVQCMGAYCLKGKMGMLYVVQPMLPLALESVSGMMPLYMVGR